MRDLIIKGNDRSPSITFIPAEEKFEISGESRPEDARGYFQPVAKWIEDFSRFAASGNSEKKISYRFVFKLEYMNSISTKIIFDLLKKLEAIHGLDIVIGWYYASDDTDMRENGREYANMLKLKFEFHPQDV